MKKEELELKISGLEKAIATCQDETSGYEDSLKATQKQLQDINKIALPPSVLDEISDAIERGINEFDFNDTNNYDMEFSIGYDNRIELDSLYLTHSDDLEGMIMDRISEIFTEAECPEDEPTANEIAQKADEACN